MKANSIMKRVLSVLLVSVMLFSCWVFTAPIQSSAASTSQGKYQIQIWVQSKNKADSDWSKSHSYLELWGKKPDGTSCSSISITGIANSDASDKWFAYYGEMDGIPTSFKLHIANAGSGATELYLRRINIAAAQTMFGTDGSTSGSKYDVLPAGVTNLVQCDIGCYKNQKNPFASDSAYEAKVTYNIEGKTTGDGVVSNNWSEKGSNVYSNVQANHYAAPAYNSCSISYPNRETTITSSVNTLTPTYTIKDQYGVVLSSTVTFALTRHQYDENNVPISTAIDGAPVGTFKWVDHNDDKSSVSINASTGVLTANYANGWRTHDLLVTASFSNIVGTTGTKTATNGWNAFRFPEYTVTYNYRTTKAATISVSGSDAADRIYYPIENSYDLQTVTKTVLYGDTAPLPSSSEFSSHYYYLNGDNGHYWGGSFSAPTSVKEDKTGNKAINISYSSVPDSNAYKHNWGSWTNYTGTSDNMSGDTYHRSTCSKQGDTHYRYQKHVYNQTTVHDSTTELVAPTCTAGGRYVKTCVCGKVDPTFDKNNPNTTSSGTNASAYVPTEGDGAALGHDWTKQTVNDNRLYQAATCLKPAKYYYSCSRCGISEENANHTFENGTGTGHTFIADSWQQITAEEGYETYQGTTYNASEYHKHSCITAGCSLDDAVDIHEKYRTDYKTHNWEKNDGKIKWYDNEDGTQCYKKCDDCGYKLYASHTYTSVPTQPTCTADGFITHTCNTCGYIHIEYPYTESGNEEYKALGHKLDGVALTNDNAEGHYKVCARCHENIKSDGTIGKDAHTPASAVREKEVSPDCTTDGSYDSVIYCSNPDCHYEISRTPTVIPALGHDFTVKTVRDETTEKVAPTCLAPGQYYYTCSRCAAVSNESGNELYYTVDDDGEGKALGHKWVRTDKEAVDNYPGYVYYCCERNCGNYHLAKFENGKYSVDDQNEYTSISQMEQSGNKVSIPAPFFNDSNTYDSIYEGFDYSKRLASIKYMSPSETGSQTMRYAGSVKIPEGIGITNTNADNNIIDFGFVYTQESFILNEKNKPDPDKLVFCEDEFYNSEMKTNYNRPDQKGFRVYKMSLAENNPSSTNISDWEGCTPQNSGNTVSPDYLSFNLVINIKAKNWHVVYVARPYVTYKYHNVTYTVYDGGASSISEESSYYHRSVCSFSDSAMSYAYFLTTEGEYEDEYGSYGEYATLVEDAVGEMSYEDYCAGVSGVIRDKKYIEERIIGYLDSPECTLTEEQKTNIKNEFKNQANWLSSADAQDFLDYELKAIYGI